MKKKIDEDRNVIRLKGSRALPTPLILLLISFLGILSAFAIFMRSRGSHFLIIGGCFALFVLLCALFLLRGVSTATIFDFERGTVKINAGVRAETMRMGDVLCIRPVTRESNMVTDEKIAWCLFARGDSCLGGRVITPFLKKGDSYARELETAIVPEIEARLGLGASAKPRVPILAAPTCFKRNGRTFEHAANSTMGMLFIVLMALITLFFIINPLLTSPGKTNIVDLLLLLPLVLLSGGIPLYRTYGDIAKTDRRIVVDTGRRAISTYRGFSRRPRTFSFDDLKHVYVGISSAMFGNARQRSVHLAFGESGYRIRIANGNSEKVEKILASYALVTGMDLSGKIEYIA